MKPAAENPLETSPATLPPSANPSTGPSSAPGTTRKIRSDAKLEQLNPARRERLRVWLDEENLSYAEVVNLLRAEFGLFVGQSAVALYWRRHLLPRQHQDEAEIAAVIAALPAAAFDAATLNQARALAWTALTRQFPQVQDAATLLQLLHRADRLALARQRLALEERRVALREAQADVTSHSPRPRSPEKRREPPPASQASAAQSRPSPVPKHPAPIPPEPPATSAPPSPAPLPPYDVQCSMLNDRCSNPPRFPGYSGLLRPPADAQLTDALPSLGPPPEHPDSSATAAADHEPAAK